MKSNNKILNAVVSKLASERDEVLVQLDLILNHNRSSSDDIVRDAVDSFKNWAHIEKTLELVNSVIADESTPQEQVNQILEEINKKTKKKNGNIT